MNKIREANLVNLLSDTKEILESLDIPYWLECGTLLGAIREKRFLSWEDDLDFGVWDVDFIDKIKAFEYELEKRGYLYYLDENNLTYYKSKDCYSDINIYTRNDNLAIVKLKRPLTIKGKLVKLIRKIYSSPKYYSFTFKSKYEIIRSFFILCARCTPYELRNAIISNCSDKTMNDKEIKDISWYVPYKYLKSLRKINFYNINIPIPDKSEEYLSYRYGDDWHIPKKDWITEDQDATVNRSNDII